MTTMWTCQSCGAQRTDGSGLIASVVPATKLGKCWREGKQTVWRPGPPVNAGAEVGERLAQRGMGAAERAAIPEGWTERADAMIKQLARAPEPFTSDVLVAAVGAPDTHFNAIGARMNAAARAGVIRKVGFTKSSRESGHARTIAVWEGVR